MCYSYKDKYDIAVPFRELEELEREELASESLVKYYREGTVKDSVKSYSTQLQRYQNLNHHGI